jgi:lactate permease
MQVLPAIIACGVSFAGVQFLVSNTLGPELTDIMVRSVHPRHGCFQ